MEPVIWSAISVLLLLIMLVLWLLSRIIKQFKTVGTELHSTQEKMSELLQSLEQLDHLKSENLCEETREVVLERALTVRRAVKKQTNTLTPTAFEQTPIEPGFQKETLAKCFHANELIAIEQFWDMYQSYLQTYWLTKDRSYKTVFTGQPHDPQSEWNQVVQASKQTLAQLDAQMSKFSA
ncbi:hypothetical protein [Salsuginibacillus kocurii]|uniref:hypothetical protein n=1 Tax=Salsuginibacillus kocurii TaxID=427078 RepID=UPI000379EC28|nr:hypothetical protein [Salsuginibacillus kocurii]